MKPFLKYIFLGFIGLVLQVSFPQLQLNWLVLWAALAFGERGLGFALLVSGVLALVTSSSSVVDPLFLFLPLATGMLSFPFFSRFISFPPTVLRFGLVLYLCLNTWIFEMAGSYVRGTSYLFTMREVLWVLATAAVGAFVLPVLLGLLARVARALPFGSRRTGELDYFRARRQNLAETRTLRKPFGLQKGI